MRSQYNAGRDDSYIRKDEYPLLTNTHKHDGILNDYGDGKFEDQEIDDIAEKYFKPMDNGKLKHKK